MTELLKKIDDLDRRILDFIQSGVTDPGEERFNQLSLDVFALQYAHIPLYRKYCGKRGATPEKVFSWQEIPAVPTAVFKVADLCILPDKANRVFMTSGTSNPAERGRVRYDAGGLRLMDATIKTAAAAFLFPDGVHTQLMVIAPSPELAPNMVMAYGMNRLIEHFGGPGSRFLVNEKGFDVKAFINALNECQRREAPVTLCGGSFGFVNFFDFCAVNGYKFKLPQGSRCLDAGGFKGKSRAVTRGEFLDMCRKFLGLSRNRCVNLLGMTEISSQFYDNTIKNTHSGATGSTVKCNPPWTRTEVVDPDTLLPLPEGETGLLKHLDLANRGHIIAIQTDDVGRMLNGGFEILGRAEAGEARGCSLTIDEMTRVMEKLS
ncbi:MAG: hypothetical protein RBT11_18605 [Desulfobacterales bacterium]|jgi:hypothetical protein|nr:hypothetical protein [Desulfobacterales bacterium]